MRIKITVVLFGLTVASAPSWAEEPLTDMQEPIAAQAKTHELDYFKPRDLQQIPAGEFGDKVRRGYQLFVNTQQLKGVAVGNQLNCTNCHLGSGTKANSTPLWAAYLAYPAYRKKDNRVSNFAERLQGCFNYSMNGKAPALDSPDLVALSAYSYWLLMGGLLDMYGMQGQPVPEMSDQALQLGGAAESFKLPGPLAGKVKLDARGNMPGRGYPELAKPAQAPSPERGSKVFTANCSSCHGEKGQGTAMAGVPVIPPVWGAQSYNWGAGMHRVNTAAAFIYENMPLGKGIQLSEQQAWDVAAYINSQERPQDPRFTGDVLETAQKYHASDDGYYGKVLDGQLIGSKAYPTSTAP